MSCQRGNLNRTRPQKHKNSTAFKNDLHDKSDRTQFINNLNITDVCEKCKAILDWKIKYKKYKVAKKPKTCLKCHQKTVKMSYRVICAACAINLKVCPKCGKSELEVKMALAHQQNNPIQDCNSGKYYKKWPL
ncbi:hypothetical protein AAG570_008829 [Ranatra chinensis]|uniref:Uncharacterized protein n=1 Tax=Ranatra chinensis TaxID=642074 RepID=A0ABD0YS39_9HEMI